MMRDIFATILPRTHDHIMLAFALLICDQLGRMDPLQAWGFGHGWQSSVNVDHSGHTYGMEGVIAMLANSMLTSQ